MCKKESLEVLQVDLLQAEENMKLQSYGEKVDLISEDKVRAFRYVRIPNAVKVGLV